LLHIPRSEIAARGVPLAKMALSRCITAQNPKIGSSYPEGNFGGNQLLGGSMSLSPLYRALTNDLHVSTAMPTSIAVSSDFVVARYSSPPFGSLCKYSRSTGVTLTSCRRPLRASVIHHIHLHENERIPPSFSISLRRFGMKAMFRQPARTRKGLLGPCYKTEGTESPFQRRFLILHPFFLKFAGRQF